MDETLMLCTDLKNQFISIVGEKHALTQQDEITPHVSELRGLFFGESELVLFPGSTLEVSKIMALASETKTPIVPQAGNTGLTGAQIPTADLPAVIVCTRRLNKIKNLNLDDNVIEVEAGVILADIQKLADDNDRLFPLSLSSEGSCQIGGNLSTNAGGTGVLAYGNTRNLCLGLEVVLPTGEIWNGLRKLKKDNTGYDLRDLFIGAEGTLGIITGAVLKVFPKPKGRQVVIAGLESAAQALELYGLACDHCGNQLTAFELMSKRSIEFTLKHTESARSPLQDMHDWFVLLEVSSLHSQEMAEQTTARLLETAWEKGYVSDAALSQSEQHYADFWHIRESMPHSQKPEGGSIKNDISVPVSKIPAFFEAAEKAILALEPDARIVAFGHMGDGNIHYNVSQPVDCEQNVFLEKWKLVTGAVHKVVMQMDGSISAEHGIGQLKRDELAKIRQPIEIDLMQRIKKSFDPAGIMNPNKVLKSHL